MLVKQRDALDEILEVGPLALNNLALTYNPQAGTLDTRANIGELVGQIERRPRDVPLRPHQPGQGRRRRVRHDPAGAAARGRAPAGARPGPAPDQQFDPTLGGLVEVSR